MRWSPARPAEPSSVTVSLDPAGQYHASFVVELATVPLPPTDRECGLDLGLTRFAALDDGRLIEHPRILRTAERRLKHAQRGFCRTQQGSANREQARRRVTRRHARVTDTRYDWLHQTSTALLRGSAARSPRL